jgi:hypothetical protein
MQELDRISSAKRHRATPSTVKKEDLSERKQDYNIQ